MWDKLVLAARAIAAVENPEDVCVIAARKIGQRGCLKYARYTGELYQECFFLIIKTEQANEQTKLE